MFPTINSGSPILEDTKICKIVTSFGECSILSYCLKDDEKFTTNILGFSNLNCQSYRKVSLPRGHGDGERTHERRVRAASASASKGESPSPAWRWPAAGAHTPVAHGRSSKGREREIGRKGRTTESNTAAV